MLDGASPGSGKYQAQTVSAPQHFQFEDGYPGMILGIFFIFYDFPESAVSGALFFDQLFRLYLLADFINLVPGGGNGTVHICDMLLKILVV